MFILRKKLTRIKNKIKKAPLSSYVAFSIAIIILYTIVVTILATTTGLDYSSYYSIFCGVFGGEVLMCAMIKVFKLRGDSDNEG